MKILDRYILKSFVIPFCATFFVVLLVFVMQILWLYSDDIIGKGLSTWTIVELMFFMSVSMVPMALPVSILLSSIMAFGNLSENSELSALKAAGIPLSRIMRSLIVLMAFVAYGAFVFSNKVIPYANFRSENMLINIVNQKPAFSLQAGVFSTMGNFTIRVDKKLPTNDENKDSIIGVRIYDLRQREGTSSIITAKSGTIGSTANKKYMILTLYNGNMYEEVIPQSQPERVSQTIKKSTFDKQIYPIDISDLSLDKIKDNKEKERHSMLDISQLKVSLDSLKKHHKKEITTFANDFLYRTYISYLPADSLFVRDTLGVTDTLKNVLSYLPTTVATNNSDIYKNASTKIRQGYEYLNQYSEYLRNNSENINSYGLEIQRKYALAFSVIVLFFVGAPLGALIRKGGLGLPVVVAISIFIVYHILFMFGERMGKDGSLDVITARWLPTLVLLPLGIWLTYRATKDAVIVNMDPILNYLNKKYQSIPDKYKFISKLNSKIKKQNDQPNSPV